MKSYVKANVLRQAFIVIICVSVFLQSLHQFVLTAQYVLQTSQQKLENCINKNKPETHCEGKCQLARKLKSGAENSESANLKNSNISDLFSESYIQLSFSNFKQHVRHQDSFHFSLPITYSDQRLRPPAII